MPLPVRLQLTVPWKLTNKLNNVHFNPQKSQIKPLSLYEALWLQPLRSSRLMYHPATSPQMPPSYLDNTLSTHFLLFNISSQSVHTISYQWSPAQTALPCSQASNISQPFCLYRPPSAVPLWTSNSPLWRWMWTSNNWMACLLLCEYKLRHKHMAHNCIQQHTSESVRLIYNSGSDVPMNLLRSREWSGAGERGGAVIVGP